MKRSLSMLVFAAALAAPALSHAQSNGPETRQQVRNELAQLRAAGYNGDAEATYPSQLLSAERRVSARQAAQDSSYGPQTAGTAMGGDAFQVQAWAGESNGRIQP